MVGYLIAAGMTMAAPCAPSTAASPLNEIITADNQADIRRVMSLYSEDPIWISASTPPLRGPLAIRRSYEVMYRDFTPHLTIAVDRIRTGDGIAVVAGRTSGSLNPRKGGGRHVVADEFEAVVLCESGRWKVSVLRWWPRRR